MKKNKEPKEVLIAVIDCETDPFKYSRVPAPFAIEFYSDKYTEVFWGDDCISRCMTWLEKLEEEYIIFAHNGGKFDFHFMHEYIDNPLFIIKSRIIRAALFHHTLADSYAILPVPLRDYAKDTFDYKKMERHKRNRHKKEILEYLHHDCVYLFQLVSKFVEQFGIKKTIGSTAMASIKSMYEFAKLTEHGDEYFRQFYFGGRVQCIKSGILQGPWKLYDVNSMYPYVMKEYKHPVNCQFEITDEMPDNFDMPFFMKFDGINRGALPMKTKAMAEEDTLDFTVKEGTFYACSHEIQVGLELGLIEIKNVHECYISTETINFAEYVDTHYAAKVEAEQNGDKAGRLFAKLLLNSGYGKFGQNPDNFREYFLNRDFGDDERLREEGWELECDDFTAFELWSKPVPKKDNAYFDVSIAASITSAARACLLRGLYHSVDPIYCDTDCVIARDIRTEGTGILLDQTALGAWKLEKEAEFIAIAGKKLYALYDQKERKLKEIKRVSKGGTLTLAQIRTLAKGYTVETKLSAPVFSIKKQPTFLSRRFAKTVDADFEGWHE